MAAGFYCDDGCALPIRTGPVIIFRASDVRGRIGVASALHLTLMHRRITSRLLACVPTLTIASCREPTAPVDTFRTVPAAVLGGRVFSEVTAGDFHTCALTADQKAYCWGVNTQGQSGNGL